MPTDSVLPWHPLIIPSQNGSEETGIRRDLEDCEVRDIALLSAKDLTIVGLVKPHYVYKIRKGGVFTKNGTNYLKVHLFI